jgi:Tol biopolymer transport system component
VNSRSAIVRSILLTVLLTVPAAVCQARFTYLPTVSAPAPVTAPLADAPGPIAPTGPILSERLVPLGGGTRDRLVLKGTPVASPDAAHVAYKHRWGEAFQYVGYALDDHSPLGVRDMTDPSFAPDSQSVAVVVKELAWKLRHQKRILPGFEPVSKVRFSPDGQRMVYLARLEKERFVVEGDQPQPLAELIAWDQLVFSPDSSALAYPAFDGRDWRMVVNGDPGEAWDRIATAPITAQRGSGVFYVAVKHNRFHLIDRHNPTPGGGFRQIDGPPALSADGSTFAYWAMDDEQRWRVYKNHLPVPGYDAQRPGQLVISPDGQNLAAVLKRDGQWRVVFNGQPGPGYDSIGKASLTLSPDGARFAYAAGKPGGWALVVDGQEQQTFAQLLSASLRFSPDSQRFAYGALTQGRWSIVVDDTPQQPFNQIDARTITFSPNSQSLAYLAYQAGAATIVTNGEAVGAYDHASQLTFSPDSRHLVWVAEQAGQSFLFVDGTPNEAPFDHLVPGAHIQFTSNTACQTVATRRPGPTFWRIELALAPAQSDISPDYDPDSTPGPPAPPEPMSPFVDVPTE